MEHAQHTHGGPKLYTAVLGGLVTLTVLTVVAAGINFGSPSVNTVIALVIATAKASLVALFFMHLRWDKPMNALIFVSTLAFLGLLLIFTMIDFDTRNDIVPRNLNVAPVTAPAVSGTPR
jgi:cytochrome c oxidase subunit IV